MSIEDFKQYMLELSDRGIILDDNDWSYEQWQLWKACYDIVYKDGYIYEEVECLGMIEPKLTPKGKLFLLEGGYVGQRRKEVTSNITQWSIDVLKDTLSMFISNGIADALKLK